MAQSPRRRPGYPGSLTDLSRFRKSVHGHDGTSRIVMVRKTDQRTFASIKEGESPKLETITRETIETFRGQRTECKITTEKKDCQDKLPPDLIGSIERIRTPVRKLSVNRKTRTMDFQNECLRAHNDFRQKHGVPPLKLNKEMCRLCQTHADYLVKRSTLEHSNNRDYGENIYAVTSTNPNVAISGEEPVKSWYEEVSKHKFGVEPQGLCSGHFTLVVWKETRELGVAFAKAGGKIVVVANYYPSGNIIGHFAENVPPVGGFPDDINGNFADGVKTLSVSSIDTSSNSLSPLGATTPKSTVSKLANGVDGNFEEDFLEAHNEYRRLHGVPPLKLDRKLCKYSEEWAKILAGKNNMEHRKNSPYGENIFGMFSSDPSFVLSGRSPVDAWYEEIKYHPFGKEPHSLKSGHFTQVVWKSSEFLGVGVAQSRQGYYYVVANYSPAGNFVRCYVENVPPLLSEGAGVPSPAAVSPDPGPGSGEFNQFAIDGLNAHNELRRKHGVPALKLSKELCEFAQEWANTCAKTSTMNHRQGHNFGENLFSMYSSDFSRVPDAKDVVKNWYEEIKLYKFGSEKVISGTLHFSQVVWRDTTELGFAMAKNSRGTTFVVANYSPRGNIVGQFIANVPKAKP